MQLISLKSYEIDLISDSIYGFKNKYFKVTDVLYKIIRLLTFSGILGLYSFVKDRNSLNCIYVRNVVLKLNCFP